MIITIISVIVTGITSVAVAIINSRVMHYKTEAKAELERAIVQEKLDKMEKRLDDLSETDSCCATLQQDVIAIKKEQSLTFKALIACLDGLQQLGCNSTVTATHNELQDWLNAQAHE